jgi:hypothetical protein
MAVWRHARLRGDTRAVTLIPLLYVALICKSLLGIHGHVRHVVARHVRLLRDTRSIALRDVLVRWLLGGFNLVTTINAVFVAGSRFGRVQTSLDQVLAFRLGDERLQFRRRERVNQASFGDDQEKNLCACKDRELICLLHNASFTLRKCNMPSRLVADELDFNLPSFAAALLIIVIFVVCGRWALALHAAGFLDGGAIADGVSIVELGRRGLVVLICDVGHGVCESIFVSNWLGFDYLKRGRALVCITTNEPRQEEQKKVVEILL